MVRQTPSAVATQLQNSALNASQAQSQLKNLPQAQQQQQQQQPQKQRAPRSASKRKGQNGANQQQQKDAVTAQPQNPQAQQAIKLGNDPEPTAEELERERQLRLQRRAPREGPRHGKRGRSPPPLPTADFSEYERDDYQDDQDAQDEQELDDRYFERSRSAALNGNARQDRKQQRLAKQSISQNWEDRNAGNGRTERQRSGRKPNHTQRAR